MSTDDIFPQLRSLVESHLSSPRSDSLEVIEDRTRRVTRELGRVLLQAQLDELSESAHHGYVGPRTTTPRGESAEFERYQTRCLDSYLGEIRLTRAYYVVASAAKRGGFVPLDEQLGLGERKLTPSLQRGITMLGVELPFARAERLLTELTAAEVAPKTIADVTEAAGEQLSQAQQQRVEQAWRVFDGPSAAQAKKGRVPKAQRRPTERLVEWSNAGAPERLYVQADGGRVNTTQGWKEPKVAVLFEAKGRIEISRERGELYAKEYVATMQDIGQFQRIVWEASLRWGALSARQIVVLGDGAEGFQKRLGELFPDAIQILDWYHATEHLWEFARALYGSDELRTKAWAEAKLKQLREGKVKTVLSALRKLELPDDLRKQRDELVKYYSSNAKRMRYAEFEAEGIFIGSGAVESAVKNVVNNRMKGCGMRWDIRRADQLLTARARHLSSRIPLIDTSRRAA